VKASSRLKGSQMSDDGYFQSNAPVSRDEFMNLQEQLKVAKQERDRELRQNSEIVLPANALTRERDELRDRLEFAISERDRLIAERASAPDRAVILERRLEEVTREFSDTRIEVRRLQQALADTNAALITNTGESQQKISNLRQSLAETTEKRDLLATEKLEIEKRAASAEQKLLQSNQRLNEAQTKNMRLEGELAELQNEMTTRTNSFTSDLSELRDRLGVITSERDKFASEISATIDRFIKTERQLLEATDRIANNESEISRLQDLADDKSIGNIARLLYAFTAENTKNGVSRVRAMIPNDSPLLPYFDKTNEFMKIFVTQAQQVSQKAYEMAKPHALELYRRVKQEIDNQVIKK